jgi:hypothetical protein
MSEGIIIALMRSRVWIPGVVLVAFELLGATPALAKPTTPAQLEALGWRLMKPYREEKIMALFAPDLVTLYADGRHNRAQEMRNISSFKLRDYELGRIRSHSIDADNVLLTYSVDLRGTVGTRTVSGRRWVASLWHRSHGKWLTVYHTEVKAK